MSGVIESECSSRDRSLWLCFPSVCGVGVGEESGFIYFFFFSGGHFLPIAGLSWNNNEIKYGNAVCIN